jgi:hypothetical protein
MVVMRAGFSTKRKMFYTSNTTIYICSYVLMADVDEMIVLWVSTL